MRGETDLPPEFLWSLESLGGDGAADGVVAASKNAVCDIHVCSLFSAIILAIDSTRLSSSLLLSSSMYELHFFSFVHVKNHDEFHVRLDAATVLGSRCGRDPRPGDRFLEEVAVLGRGSEIAQQRAIVALKTFQELGESSIVQGFLLQQLPWQTKLSLERLTVLDRKPSFNNRRSTAGQLPKRHWIAQYAALLRDGSESEQLRAIQDLAPVMERAGGDPLVLDLILSTDVIEALAAKLDQSAAASASSSSRSRQHSGTMSSSNRIKSEVCFALVKISSGSVKCIKAMIKAKVVDNLVLTMASTTSSSALQEAAYSTLHNLVFTGRRIVTEHILRAATLVDRMLILLDAGLQIGLYCVQDLVEIGGKDCIEKLLSARVVERLVAVESNSRGKFRDLVLEFAKLVVKSSGLSAQEHRALNSQALRHARAVVKDPKQLGKITSVLRTSFDRGEGSGSGSGSSKRRNST